MPGRTPIARTELVVSPAAELFPQRQMDSIRSEQFVERKELPADNLDLINQLKEMSAGSAFHLAEEGGPESWELHVAALLMRC